MAARLKERYAKEIAPAIAKEFDIKNPMAIPRIEKVVINMGLGEASANAKATHPLLRPKGHVAGVGELEAIRDELMSRLKQARDEAEGRGQRQSRARGRRERVIGDPEAHRWQRVTNDDVGDPGCAEIRSVPRFGPIGAVAGWWRVKLSSGCPLATGLR